MLRHAALAVSALLFLVPGSLIAGALQARGESCEERGGCCCEVPEGNESGPAWTERCCCEVQPVPLPEDRPRDPLPALNESSSAPIAWDCADAQIPGASGPQERTTAQPAYLAHPPPDPLFLRYRALRL